MGTSAGFVHPFASSWIRPGIHRRGRTNFIGSEHNLACVTSRASSSRSTVTSNMFARRFLLNNRRAGFGSETVYYKPTEEQEQQEQQEQQEEHEEAARPTESTPKKEVILKRTGMNSPMVLSKELQEFIGEDIMTRTKIISRFANYIREKDLYMKEDRRRFVVDQFLANLLKVDGDHSLLSLQRLISKHLTRPDDVGPEYVERSRRIYQEYLKEKGAVDSKVATHRKDPRGLNSLKTQRELKAKGKGMYAPVIIDPCLQPIIGCESMSRPQMLQAVWKYIKKENLQDPSNRRRIIVSDELREGLKITDAETIDCFHVGRYLWKLCKGPSAK